MLVKSREIKLDKKDILNKNISVKIGAAENRDNPESIYIEISFWVENKNKDISSSDLKRILRKQLQEIYEKDLCPKLDSNYFFVKPKDNLYILNIPENIDYNGKRNFVSIELTLHTINLMSKKQFPLNNKKNTELFDEAMDLVKTISLSKYLNENPIFNIRLRK